MVFLMIRVSKYFLIRVVKTVTVVFLTTTVTFFLLRLMPSSPVDILIEQFIAQGYSYREARDAVASLFSLDLDKPLLNQYFEFLWNIIHFDFGKSFISTGTPVLNMITEFLPYTLFILSTSMLTSFMVGILVGMFAAYRRGSLFDNMVTSFASFMSAVPNYVIGILFLYFLGARLQLFPMGGAYPPGVTPGWNLDFILGLLKHAQLPFLTYVFTSVGGWILQMKSSTLSTLGEDYVTAAKARGLKENRIVTAYVGRNAILPLFTSLTIQIGFLFGGSVLIETVFNYRGMGRLLWSSIGTRDYPVIQACFFFITISTVVSNFLADILYSILDPRIKEVGR